VTKTIVVRRKERGKKEGPWQQQLKERKGERKKMIRAATF
jgi:hypothetical protein